MEKNNLLTIPLMFQKTAELNFDKNALGFKENKNGEFTFISYKKLATEVYFFSSAMLELGLKEGDRVAIMSENCPEWVIADLGIMSIGCINVPLYPTITSETLEYILNNSGCRLLIVSNNIHYQKALKIFEKVPSLQFIINIRKVKEAEKEKIKKFSFEDILNLGKRELNKNKGKIEKLKNALNEENVCSIIYTSGTTGEPKGVMLSHKNFLSNAIDISEAVLEKTEIENFVELSFLPLSHVFERVVYYSLLLVLGSTIVYAEGFEKIHKNLNEVKPNIFISVPRIYEKIQEKVMIGVNSLPPLRKNIFNWALKVGKEYHEAKKYERVPVLLELEHLIADRFIYSKIRERLGGNLQILISGGAPLMKSQAEFFAFIGLPILEGYGLTESSPVISVNRPGKIKIGTVGQIIPNVQVIIAEDGEILAKGPNIMKGYYNDQEATDLVIDSDGWLHTGDIGELDSENYLKITDRKKEIIVMSNGKNVSPQPIENMLVASEYIKQAIVIGDNQKYISALIVPDFSKIRDKIKILNLKENDLEEVSKDPGINNFYREIIEKQTKGKLANYEAIKQFRLISEEFSLEKNELTPKLSLKRKVISEIYKNLIESMYNPQKIDSEKINLLT